MPRQNTKNNNIGAVGSSNTNKANKEKLNNLRWRIIVGLGVVIPVVLAFLSVLFYSKMGDALKLQTADNIQNITSQMELNINAGLQTIEDNVKLLMSDSEIMSYMPSGSHDLAVEESIDTKLYSYALYSYYADFCIVYSDSSYIGKASEGLIEGRSDRLYPVLEKAIVRSAKGWTSEVLPGRFEITYLCRINDEAIAVVSAPSDLLTADYKNRASLIEGMEVFVADRSLVIISTSDESIMPGSYLKTQISRNVDRESSISQIGENYIVSTDKLDNEWFVITAVPSDDTLNILKDVMTKVIIASVVISLLALGYVILFAIRITESINQTVDKLDVKAQKDLLTGIYNKRSFEEIVDGTLNNPEDTMSYALIFMDIDNFKNVNDRCGHDVGDIVLKRFAHTIDTVFRDTDIKGRLGGDEFCVLVRMPIEGDRDQLISNINEVCRRFTEALHKHATSARQDLPAVTSSMGAALWDGVPEGFEQLYHKADTALYASKKRGKDTWTIYGQNSNGDNLPDRNQINNS